MIETTEREKKLLKIIDDLLHILNIYIVFFDGLTKNVKWVMDGEAFLSARDKEDDALNILNSEFGTNYHNANTSDAQVEKEV